VDTYGDPLVSQAVCSSPPAGYVTDDNDCDDSNAAINPAATEVYNDVDDDCDGEVDDGIIWYLDADGDGYSSGDTTTYPPGSDDYQRFELLATVGDCNDSDDTVHPGNKNCYGNAVGGEVLIGAGGECFEMGDSLQEGWSDETEVHPVCFTSDFYMDKYEVTNAEYEACVDAGDCTAPASNVSDTRRSSPWYYGNSYYDNFPVIYVNWNQAAQYCSAQGKRLPTEAEWEYAARGGLSGKRYPWGDTLDSGNYANYYTSWDPWQDAWVPEDTAPGGFYAYNGSEPNGYGLYDMAGNVHEWVADWYSGGFYYGLPDPVFDPINTTVGTYKVERGGAYLSPRNYTEVFDPVIDSVRVSMRHEYDPASGEVTIGIRCVRDP